MREHSGRWRRMLRVAAWNLGLLAAGLALVVVAAELWLRATRPFAGRLAPMHFVPDVGHVRKPDAEIRRTNHADFWTVSRTNRLGFADREPIDPARAAAGCHVVAIGDSFVEALEVPIADKFHVRLETLARRELPDLDVTTSAFGNGGFAPVNELAFYDEYARHLHPRLVVLVFTVNDLWDNHSLLRGLGSGWDPDRLPFVSARRGADGAFILLPPDPEPVRFRGLVPAGSMSWTLRAHVLLGRYEARWYVAAWLRHRIRTWRGPKAWSHDLRVAMAKSLRRRPHHAAHLDDLSRAYDIWSEAVRAEEPAPVFKEALALAAFTLDRFLERAERDGVRLVILATHALGGRGDPAFDRLHAMAAVRGIPVIGQHEWIVGRGGEVRDAHWPRDGHWSPAGHRWAAEAVLEHLRRNPDVCRPRG